MIDTVIIHNKPYSLLVIADSDESVFVYAIPCEEFEAYNLLSYQQVKEEELPRDVQTNINNGHYIKLNVATALSS